MLFISNCYESSKCPVKEKIKEAQEWFINVKQNEIVNVFDISYSLQGDS